MEVLGAGRFELRGTLGSGGAGVVYRAFDRCLGREVALKLLRQASGRDLFRFKREFRELADLVHPNLVALHELHATGGDWYFTMELVEGVSFIDWVRPGRGAGPSRPRGDILAAALDEPRLRGALVQLADAIHALHRAGKLHRDLKPSNVLVAPDGRLVLLDFGLVTSVAEGDPERLAVGTPVYMSPEQAADQALAEPSDWYGVGAMLYEALTGRRPFEGDSERVMTRKQTEHPAPPTRRAAGAPPELAKLCMALLQPRPAARPAGPEILEHLGAAPSPRTRAIARSYPPAVFVGRAAELAALGRALDDARRAGACVCVRGPGGIGKTTLVRRFLRGLGDAVCAVEGRLSEREAVPLRVLDGLVDALTGALVALPPDDAAALAPADLGALARLFPVLLRVPQLAELARSHPPLDDPEALRRRGLAALAELIARLARLRPVVLFADDVHWGDAESAAFLAGLVHAGEPGVLVIAAHRPEDPLGAVARLHRPPGARGGDARALDIRTLDLGPLGEAEAAALVGPLAPDAARAAAVAAAAGSPLLLLELARVASAGGAAPAELRIEDLVRGRAGRLDEAARALLAMACVAGRPLPVALAARAAGVTAGHDAAARLAAERLVALRQVGGRALLHPAHDHVRDAILGGLDAGARARGHEALARAFEAEAGGAGGVAGEATGVVEAAEDLEAAVEHWLAAGQPAAAARHAAVAAQRAESTGAFHRAAARYELALTHGAPDASARCELLRRRARALACAGQLDEAAAAYGLAARSLSGDGAGGGGGAGGADDLERLRVEALLRRGRVDEALPPAEQLLARLGVRIPLATHRSRLRLATSWVQGRPRAVDFTERAAADVPPGALLAIDALLSIAGALAHADPALGRAVQVELLRAALDAGEPARVCRALAQEVGYAAAGGGRNRAALDAASARLRLLAMQQGDAELAGLADTALGVAAHRLGRWRDARGHLEAGLAALRAHGAGPRWELDAGDACRLATLYYLGAWREMSRDAEQLLAGAIDRADAAAQQALRLGRGSLAWLLADRPAEARAQLALAERALPRRAGGAFLWPHAQAAIAAIEIELYAGDGAAAAARLDAVWGDVERLGCLHMQQVRIELAILRARTLLATLAPDPSEDRLRPIRVIADDLAREDAEWATALGHFLHAAVHAWKQDGAAARTELLAAEALLARSGMMGLLQIARLRRGTIEGDAAGTARADAALEMMRDLGAVEPQRVARHLALWPLTSRGR